MGMRAEAWWQTVCVPLGPQPNLCCVSLQARMAGERGASAVLFDITEDRAAAEQVPGDMGVLEKGTG